MAENQTIILKYSATAGKVPTLANLVRGELAINSADGKLFIRKAGATEADDTIISINVKKRSFSWYFRRSCFRQCFRRSSSCL